MIDTARDVVVNPGIPVGDAPFGVAVAPNGKIYVTNQLSDTVGVLEAVSITGFSPLSGTVSGGTTVTVTGRKFTDAFAVTFAGAAAASFEVVDDSTITAVTAPVPGPVAGLATVATPDGIAASTEPFTYIPREATTTTLTAQPDTPGPGQPVTLTATVASAGGSPISDGSVTFLTTEDGPALTTDLDSTGHATANIQNLDQGFHQALAVYQPTTPARTSSASGLIPITVPPEAATSTTPPPGRSGPPTLP